MLENGSFFLTCLITLSNKQVMITSFLIFKQPWLSCLWRALNIMSSITVGIFHPCNCWTLDIYNLILFPTLLISQKLWTMWFHCVCIYARGTEVSSKMWYPAIFSNFPLTCSSMSPMVSLMACCLTNFTKRFGQFIALFFF